MPRNNHGFSLVEILIAISIMGVVSVMSFPTLRRFNTSQKYQNSVTEFKNYLKKAQSSYTNGTRCTSAKATTGYSVILTNVTTAPAATLRAYCIDAAFVTSAENLTAFSLESTAITSTTCPAGTSTIELVFNKNGFSYLCNGAGPTLGVFALNFQNTSNTNQNINITVTTSGVIREI